MDSGYRKDTNYYPQVISEECKYDIKEKTMPKFITDDIKISSDHSNEEDSDEENSNEENSGE